MLLTGSRIGSRRLMMIPVGECRPRMSPVMPGFFLGAVCDTLRLRNVPHFGETLCKRQ
jgi:hypothetical protein